MRAQTAACAWRCSRCRRWRPAACTTMLVRLPFVFRFPTTIRPSSPQVTAAADTLMPKIHISYLPADTYLLGDPAGGGFHRYSVDEFWHIPHFEKVIAWRGNAPQHLRTPVQANKTARSLPCMCGLQLICPVDKQSSMPSIADAVRQPAAGQQLSGSLSGAWRTLKSHNGHFRSAPCRNHHLAAHCFLRQFPTSSGHTPAGKLGDWAEHCGLCQTCYCGNQVLLISFAAAHRRRAVRPGGARHPRLLITRHDTPGRRLLLRGGVPTNKNRKLEVSSVAFFAW